MEVDLLTNAIVSRVGAVSGPPETFDSPSTRFSPSEAPESPVITEETQDASPDNTRTEVAKKPVQDEPPRDFRKTLEERIQAEQSQTPENAAKAQASPEPTETPNQVSAEQPQPVSAEASTNISATLDQTVAEATNMSQQGSAAENTQDLAQLLKGSELSKAVDLTGAQPGQASVMPTATTGEAANKLTELTPEQSQTDPKVAQTAQGNAASVLDAKPAAAEQIEPKMATNDPLMLKQGAVLGEKTGAIVTESLADGAKTEQPSEKSAGAVVQTTAKTDSAPQINPDVAEDKPSDTQPEQAGQGPKMHQNVFAGPDTKANTDGQTQTPAQSPDGNDTKAAEPGEKAPSDESIIQKLDAVQAESVSSQTQAYNTVASETNDAPDFTQAIPADAQQIPNARQPIAAAQTSKATPAPSETVPSSTVGEQIRESITSSSVGLDREITIRLNPPELGSVVVKFQERGGDITGLLEVSKSQTRAEIQLMLPELMRDLQESGIQVKRLEVVMTSEQDQQTLNGQPANPQQDGWGGQQDATSSDPHAPNAYAGDFRGNDSPYSGFMGGSQVYVTDKSIDMFA